MIKAIMSWFCRHNMHSWTLVETYGKDCHELYKQCGNCSLKVYLTKPLPENQK